MLAPCPEPTTLPVAGAATCFGVRRVYCVGRNYVEHIREMKEGDERDPPFFFQKPSDSILREGSEVPYPPSTDDFQHEIELVVAIGRGGSNISADQSLEHVFGYAIGIDMTRRDRQREARERGLPWEIGKSFDRSAPCGPIHPAEKVGHIGSGAISLSVNGAVRQRGDLGQMIWNVAEIVANLSQQYTLVPGDLIFTGTPAGVGPVVPGDCMTGVIAGLGEISFKIGERSV
ncbi:fumarylacetoacetate hydrolase family protein [Bradyrhizobium uaiense]|uniref:Fumarylacetoacetate hydrolase family protein n=1 Tax=Bradyrhizobium uaiense TaxID=2594946 RepID=A0A6P1BA59_9BRAD|nr:fumarylacetoacetate hydrolase family protein [Bradyrhizobium uaiense]NEU95288.1 fumarylacetoacetate hydrolase family protein [Bradyrhizobium uaiense]